MRGVKLFRILGIQISLNYTWFIVFGLVAWSLTVGYFPSGYPDLSRSAHLVMGFLGAFFLFLSVLFQELTHSYIAKREGIEVKEITLFIFGGVSQLTKEPEDPKKELRIAIGGPISSLVLALIFWWGMTKLVGGMLNASLEKRTEMLKSHTFRELWQTLVSGDYYYCFECQALCPIRKGNR